MQAGSSRVEAVRGKELEAYLHSIGLWDRNSTVLCTGFIKLVVLVCLTSSCWPSCTSRKGWQPQQRQHTDRVWYTHRDNYRLPRYSDWLILLSEPPR